MKADTGAEHGNGCGSVEMPQAYLEGMYRFGLPISPGAQHDAQREKGRSLKEVTFTCILKGDIQKDVGHMNIYANDFVNPPLK